MASTVAWLNFDAEQQRRMNMMLAALSSQGTVDELGLGVIRDLIAHTLHPGLSVLHSRAKYLLFVPRDYRNLTGNSVEEVLGKGRRAEARTTRQLVAYYRDHPKDGQDWGIVGRRQGEHTRQLPSAMYWSLLRQLGIMREPGSLTDYCHRRVQETRRRAATAALHEEGEIVATHAGAWEEVPGPSPDGFELSVDEAEWLRHRFIDTEDRPDDQRSLVSWLLSPGRTTWWADVEFPWEHPDRSEFPVETRQVVDLGRDLDAFVHSARIAYNYLCAVGKPDQGDLRDSLISKYELAARQWQQERDSNLISAGRLAELDRWAHSAITRARGSAAAHDRWSLTYGFLQQWLEALTNHHDFLDSPAASSTLGRRERWLKQSRARLGNPDRLREWEGDAGYFHFDFNWSVAMGICGDIHGNGYGDGLGTARRSLNEAA